MDFAPAFCSGVAARDDTELLEAGHRGNLRQKQGRRHYSLARIARMILPLVPRMAPLIGVALFFAFPGTALAHGGVVNDGDLCVINIGYLRAHFKIYVPQERQHQDYCEDIPVRGESVFVMEYEHDGLSEAEIDFRIIRNVTGKGWFANIEDVNAIDDLESVTLRYEPAKISPDVFTILQSFDEDGEFIGIVSARQVDTQKVYTAVFPFEVGYTGTGYWPWFLGGAILLQLSYWLFSRRRSLQTPISIALLLAGALVAPDATAADAETWVSDAGHFTVSFQSELRPLVINKIHSWILQVEDNDGEAIVGATISVVGGMPEHNHGLPTAPQVTSTLGDGRYRVEGVRFHMRGYWEIRISIDDGSQRDSVTIPVTL